MGVLLGGLAVLSLFTVKATFMILMGAAAVMGLRELVRALGQRFKETDFNGFPVMQGAQMVGFVTKFDYLACFEFTPTIGNI